MTFFSEKIYIFTAEISGELFLFSREPGFSDFPYLYGLKCRVWLFLPKKNHYFRKEFLDSTLFFYSARTLTHIRQHSLSKYGGRCMGRPPTSNFGGNRPPSPPRSPP